MWWLIKNYLLEEYSDVLLNTKGRANSQPLKFLTVALLTNHTTKQWLLCPKVACNAVSKQYIWEEKKLSLRIFDWKALYSNQ